MDLRLCCCVFSFGIAATAQAPARDAAEDAALRARIDNALDLARPALLQHLDEADSASTRPGELALVVLAAIHDGVPAETKELQRAIQRLAKAKLGETYDLALRLMVLEACPEFPGRDKLAIEDTKDLLQQAGRHGGFQYTKHPASWDLSNTQYGALGLRAAVALGQTVRREYWAKLADLIRDQQTDYGGFGYVERRGRGDPAYASMTAAGIAVLAICRQQLGAGHPSEKKLDGAIARGWQWFASNAGTIGSKQERWCYYFHYGLERAAILCDVERIDDRVDWYAVGAEMLCDDQEPGGGWRSPTDGYPGHHLAGGRGDAVPTAFAILFLRRKFQKASGPITPHVVTLAAVGPKSKDADVETCAEQLVQRGKDALPEVLDALRSDVEPRRRAAAKALLGLAGQDFGYDPKFGGDDNRAALHKAELWYLQNRGR